MRRNYIIIATKSNIVKHWQCLISKHSVVKGQGIRRKFGNIKTEAQLLINTTKQEGLPRKSSKILKRTARGKGNRERTVEARPFQWKKNTDWLTWQKSKRTQNKEQSHGDRTKCFKWTGQRA